MLHHLRLNQRVHQHLTLHNQLRLIQRGNQQFHVSPVLDRVYHQFHRPNLQASQAANRLLGRVYHQFHQVSQAANCQASRAHSLPYQMLRQVNQVVGLLSSQVVSPRLYPRLSSYTPSLSLQPTITASPSSVFSAICNSFKQCNFEKYAALYDPKCFCNENGGGMYDDGICCNTKPRCFVPNDGNEEIVDATTTHVFNANEEECAYPYHGIATHRYDTQTPKVYWIMD